MEDSFKYFPQCWFVLFPHWILVLVFVSRLRRYYFKRILSLAPTFSMVLGVEVLSSPPPGEGEAGAANYFLINSVAFLFCHIFQLTCPSFVVCSVLPVFCCSVRRLFVV